MLNPIKTADIVIEQLQANDLEAFWQVFKKVLENDFPGYSQKVIDFFLYKAYSQANFRYWLETNWKIVFIAKKNLPLWEKGKIAGFVVLDRPYGGVCFVRWLGVLKEERKKGIGKRLIKASIDFALDYGCHKIELAAQPNAKKFYKKIGLKLEGKRDLSYFGIDQYIFGMVLDKPNEEIMIKE